MLDFATASPARVAKLVDAGDSKSPGGNTVSVRVRPRVPDPYFKYSQAFNIALVFLYLRKRGRQRALWPTSTGIE